MSDHKTVAFADLPQEYEERIPEITEDGFGSRHDRRGTEQNLELLRVILEKYKNGNDEDDSDHDGPSSSNNAKDSERLLTDLNEVEAQVIKKPL